MPERRSSEQPPDPSSEPWTSDNYFNFAKAGMDRQIRLIEAGQVREKGKHISLFSRALRQEYPHIEDPLDMVAESVRNLLEEEWNREKKLNPNLSQWESTFTLLSSEKYRSNVKMFYYCCEPLPPGTPQSFEP